MTFSMPLLVFTDLDGTLLSHDTYDWRPARPALDRLARIGAAVVMASSKTAAEIGQLREEVGVAQWMAIVENGAGLLPPHQRDAQDRSTYARLRAGLDKIPASLRGGFRGFGDMETEEVAQITGLSPEAAGLAKQRAFSEPGLWSGPPEGKAAFLQALEKQGIAAREGGRFLTLSFGTTKADQMAQIVQTYGPRHTLALGDAPNDVEMLEAAGAGVIIANPHRTPLPALDGEQTGRITRSKDAGPDGWNAAVLAHLDRLKL